MHNIDFSLENENGQKAKDVTKSRKILDRIAWYESNMTSSNRRYDSVTIVEPDTIAEEDKEEEEPSSYTASPNLQSGVMSKHLSTGNFIDDKD
jgi:hypothetical protein